MAVSRLLLVGGFLGAGKTTLLRHTARRLSEQGHRVGLITNDQAPELVDTRLLASDGNVVREVAGSCFCCNFDGFTEAAAMLLQEGCADILIGEPVGSCTDLSATIVQPLKDRFADRFTVLPLCVMTEPDRLRQVFTGAAGPLHPDAAYICYKQLEEADLIVVNKIDLASPEERTQLEQLIRRHFPDSAFRFMSARTGEGVGEWLDCVLAGGPAGTRIPEVDYDRYAHGEAVLGWHNSSCDIESPSGSVDAEQVCRTVLRSFKNQCTLKGAEVGHVKVLALSETGTCGGNLTDARKEPLVFHEMSGPCSQVQLIVNARVETPQETLEVVVDQVLETLRQEGLDVRVDRSVTLTPGRPVPTHRYTSVIG